MKYNNGDLSKCHTCIQGAALTGTSPNIDACACASPKMVKKNEDNVNVCVSVIANCLYYNDGDLTKCQKCMPGYTATGASPDITVCACTGGKVEKVDENGNTVCVAEITNCMKYNSSMLNKCHTCIVGATATGTANQHDACGCDSSTKEVSVDESNNPVCAAKLNFCLKYKSGPLTNCHTCINGASGVGTANDFTSCTCDSSAGKGEKMDNTNVRSCVVLKPGCDKYLSTDLAKCHTCLADFTGVGSANDFTSCGCTDSSKVYAKTNT